MSSSAPPNPEPAVLTAEQRLRMPGMIPQETRVFDAFWKLHGAEYTAVDFNVRVGTGYDPGPSVSDEQRRNSVMNTQKRIDALLWQGSIPTIAEVKLRCTHVVAGQVLAYRLLWQRENPGFQTPNMLIICAYIDADTAYVLDKLNILVQVVTPDLTGLKTLPK